MTDLEKEFAAAAGEALNLPKKPDQATLLKLYGLYKQAKNGDVSGMKPGFTDLTGRAKWDAWAELRGTPRDQAMQDYIELVQKLKL
jgi:acyl-CoA-binding protein